MAIRRSLLLTLALGLVATVPAAASETEWAIEPSPNAIADQHNFVNGIDCVSPSECWAAGYFWDGSGYVPLLLHRADSSWSIAPAPSLPSTFMNGVTCASPSDCWAVGYVLEDGAYHPLVLGWDGAEWSVVPSPEIGDELALASRHLYGITCTSPSDCWAVGFDSRPGAGREPLIERWDGASWSVVPLSGTLPPRGGSLVSVDCTSPSDCWAVGSQSGTTASRALAARWDGSAWSVVPTPTADERAANSLSDVTCLTPSDCWAVGYQNVGATNQTQIQRWNGSTWTIVPSPNGGQGVANTLFSVSCTSPSHCWAVGYYKPGNPLQTMILRLDRDAWRLAPSPNSSAGQTNTLRAIDCVGAVCTAVGNYYNAQSRSRSLTMRHLGGEPGPLPQQPPLEIEDIAGDANGLNEIGTEMDTRPASVDGLDLVEVSARTRYESIPVGDDGIRHEPTALEIVAETSGVPDVPPGMPNAVVRLDSMAGTCRLGLDVLLVRESAGEPLTTDVLWHELGEGCPHSGSFPAIRELEEAVVDLDAEARTLTLALPFSTLTAGEMWAIGVGRTLAAPRGETRGTLLHGGGGNDLVVDEAQLIDASPRGDAFTVGSDVPPDVPCTTGCPG